MYFNWNKMGDGLEIVEDLDEEDSESEGDFVSNEPDQDTDWYRRINGCYYYKPDPPHFPSVLFKDVVKIPPPQFNQLIFKRFNIKPKVLKKPLIRMGY